MELGADSPWLPPVAGDFVTPRLVLQEEDRAGVSPARSC